MTGPIIHTPHEQEDWRMDAVCRNEDPELFFHPEGERGLTRRRRVEAAKAVCARCPVTSDCLEVSLDNNEEYGIRGGLSEEERHPLLLARRAAKRAARTVQGVSA